MKIFLLAFSLLVCFTSYGHAHWGHVGDLAGHAHWIGLGAIVVAGALIGVLGLLSDKDNEEEVEAEDEASKGEAA